MVVNGYGNDKTNDYCQGKDNEYHNVSPLKLYGHFKGNQKRVMTSHLKIVILSEAKDLYAQSKRHFGREERSLRVTRCF
jgi:hypothetical protein